MCATYHMINILFPVIYRTTVKHAISVTVISMDLNEISNRTRQI